MIRASSASFPVCSASASDSSLDSSSSTSSSFFFFFLSSLSSLSFFFSFFSFFSFFLSSSSLSAYTHRGKSGGSQVRGSPATINWVMNGVFYLFLLLLGLLAFLLLLLPGIFLVGLR